MQITNKRIVTLLTDKEELVTIGRAISKELEKIDVKIAKCEDKERAITAKVEPKELGDKAEALKAEINVLVKKFEKVSGEIIKEKLAGIPKDLEKEHKDLLLSKEAKERERNKVALKVQKIKDRVVPLIQKEVEPTLGEYDDIESATIKKGVVEIGIFSHLKEFQARFKKNK